METFILAAVSGLIIGIFSGLLGIGGGTLMIPLFRLGFGLSALSATATSLFTIIPTSLSGCITHLKNKTCIPFLGLATGLGGACTSPLGVLAANQSPGWLVMLAAALVIAFSAYTMIGKALKLPKDSRSIRELWKRARAEVAASKAAASAAAAGTASTADDGVASSASAANAASSATTGNSAATSADTAPATKATSKAPAPIERTPRRIAIGVLIGVITGFASGYVGVGGGFLMVPLFISFLEVSMYYASGTSLIAVTLLAIPGVITQGILGHIDYVAGIAIAIGSIPGAMIGASILRYTPERKLRFLFGAFLLISAVALMGNEFLHLLGA